MTWDVPLFGEAPAEQAAIIEHDAEREAFLDAKQAVLDKARLAVVDERGKHLNERRWRKYINFIGSL